MEDGQVKSQESSVARAIYMGYPIEHRGHGQAVVRNIDRTYDRRSSLTHKQI
jgi:hypothetical protein